MVAKTADAIRREQQRKARQAAELRANLTRRKTQKREQSKPGPQPDGPGWAGPLPARTDD